MIIAIFSQNWGVILRVIYYTPSYTPQYIGIAIDGVDSIGHKKSLNPFRIKPFEILQDIAGIKSGGERVRQV